MAASKVHWADYFPGREALRTRDLRIFQTNWVKHKVNEYSADVLGGTKSKQFFCCIIDSKGELDGGNCYGVTVYKGLATRSEKEVEEALRKVVEAANYYEQHGAWPKTEDHQ